MFTRRRLMRILVRATPRRRHLHGGFLHRLIGDRLLDRALWKFSPRGVAMGSAVGVFVAFTPTVPLQMLVASTACIFLRCNIPAAIIACWISNPVTIPVIYALEYKLGAWISEVLALPDFQDFPKSIHESRNLLEIMEVAEEATFLQSSIRTIKNLIIGSLVFSGVLALLTYAGLAFLFSRLQFGKPAQPVSRKRDQ